MEDSSNLDAMNDIEMSVNGVRQYGDIIGEKAETGNITDKIRSRTESVRVDSPQAGIVYNGKMTLKTKANGNNVSDDHEEVKQSGGHGHGAADIISSLDMARSLDAEIKHTITERLGQVSVRVLLVCICCLLLLCFGCVAVVTGIVISNQFSGAWNIDKNVNSDSGGGSDTGSVSFTLGKDGEPLFQGATCGSTTCSSMEVGLEDNRLTVYNSPNQVLPGVQFFTYSYNLLQGKPPMDLLFDGRYHQIISLSFDDGKVSAGTQSYLVPDQLDLPAISSVCESQTDTTTISCGTSTSSMHNHAQESTGSTSLEASISASGMGFSASASLAQSLSYSRSSAAQTSFSYAKEGKSEASYTISRAILYGATIRWFDNTLFFNATDAANSFKPKFVEDVESLHGNLTNNSILEFIDRWGSHVLVKGVLGSECRRSTHFSGGYSTQSYSRSAEQAASESSDFSAKTSGGGTAFGVTASLSASFQYASGSEWSTGSSVEGESTSSAEFSTETTYCVGEVHITNLCGEMLGRQNEPSLVQHELQPIWELSSIFSDTIAEGFETFVNAMICEGENLCGGIAIPAVNDSFWSRGVANWDGADFSQFWDESRCFDQFMIGITLLNTGNNVTSQFSTNDRYERREYSWIRYHSFCEQSGNVQIGLSLQMLVQNATYGIKLVSQTSEAFYSYFYAGAGFAINFGGAKYIIACSDIKDNLYVGMVTDRESDHDVVYLSEHLGCLSDSHVNYNVVAGFSSTERSYNVLPANFVSWNNLSYTLANDHFDLYDDQGCDITYIAFCSSARIVTYGNITVSKNTWTLVSSSERHVAVNTQWMTYDSSGACSRTNVWTGISKYNNFRCNLATWVENESSGGFQLVSVAWGDEICWNHCQVHDLLKVDFIVFCSS